MSIGWRLLRIRTLTERQIQVMEKVRMNTRSQTGKPKAALRIQWFFTMIVMVWLCFITAPGALSQTSGLIIQTGGAQDGSGSDYQIRGAVDWMHPTNSTEPEFALFTGIWSIQEGMAMAESPPVLQIQLEGEEVLVFWSASNDNFVLQVASRIDTGAAWSDVPAPYETNGSQLQAVFVLQQSPQFFRLYRP